MADDLIQTGNQLLAKTPDAWEEAMRPAVGDVRVREVLGSRFSADVKLFDLQRTVLFSLKMPCARIALPEGSGFVSVNLLSRGRIRTAAPKRGNEWLAGTAHIVNHNETPFDFTSSEDLEVLTLCFQNSLLEAYARKFHGPDFDRTGDFDTDVSLESNMGACFSRYVCFVWDELNRGGAFLQSSIATEEMEDSLWAMYMSAVHVDSPGRGRVDDGYASYVRHAEEYIVGHLDSALRVADIAEAVGVSVTTLNRAFRKHYGTGPKAFAKQRRLDRVRSELLAADPQSRTVTEIAIRYGFCHLSQFAADFKRAFHEAPSQTLRRH